LDVVPHRVHYRLSHWVAHIALLASFLVSAPANAQRVDIAAPPGSVAFGTSVTVLPGGNIVITDPQYGAGAKLGAVYLYSPDGIQISALTGSTINDQIGDYGVMVLHSGDALVFSPHWSNGTASAAGAVTRINGVTGLSGTVSPSNSLVGTKANDAVGSDRATLLDNGNFVIVSSSWSNGPATGAGAVTWVDENGALSGTVSLQNSLVGTVTDEHVGTVTALRNGNYVVTNDAWNNSSMGPYGAVRLADGRTGATGIFSVSNSLIGAKAGDAVGSGGVFPLTNGNYVVASPGWSRGATELAGAVTWVDGNVGLIEAVSENNSLVGSSFLDTVGAGFGPGVTALRNGNYVVASPFWSNGSTRYVGAVTWGNGSTGTSGAVSPVNSLVGTVEKDYVGIDRVTALSNGNYVAGSHYWHNGTLERAGAVTWAAGSTGLSGVISQSNSLVGETALDGIGSNGVKALRNGNYVVVSAGWHNGSAPVGAVTWGNGVTGLTGVVSVANSLVGTTAGDGIGSFGVATLGNGNYVVNSPFWSNGLASQAGAVTWANGATGLAGVVSPSNSLVGTTANDQIGYGFVLPLINGNYFVASPGWSNGSFASVGAITWGDGTSGISGAVSANNSLVGVAANDSAGSGFDSEPGLAAYANGNYVVASPHFHNGALVDAGAISVGRASGGTNGFINSRNSVIGTIAGGGPQMVFDYDAIRDTLAVGQPAANIVSLLNGDELFGNGFE